MQQAKSQEEPQSTALVLFKMQRLILEMTHMVFEL